MDEFSNLAQTPISLSSLNLTEQLKQRKNMFQEQVKKIERVEEILKKNPEIEELLNLTRNLGF